MVCYSKVTAEGYDGKLLQVIEFMAQGQLFLPLRWSVKEINCRKGGQNEERKDTEKTDQIEKGTSVSYHVVAGCDHDFYIQLYSHGRDGHCFSEVYTGQGSVWGSEMDRI